MLFKVKKKNRDLTWKVVSVKAIAIEPFIMHMVSTVAYRCLVYNTQMKSNTWKQNRVQVRKSLLQFKYIMRGQKLNVQPSLTEIIYSFS